MGSFRTAVMTLALALLAGPAFAGPKVPGSAVHDLPPAAQAKIEEMEKQVDQTKVDYKKAKKDVVAAKGAIKAAKLKIKAAKTKLDGDKAAKKSAKKGDDKTAKKDAKAQIDESKGRIGDEKDQLKIAKLDYDVAQAQVSMFKVKMGYDAAKLEEFKAEAVASNGGDVDKAQFEIVSAQQEIKYEESRQQLEALRAERNILMQAGSEE